MRTIPVFVSCDSKLPRWLPDDWEPDPDDCSWEDAMICLMDDPDFDPGDWESFSAGMAWASACMPIGKA